MRARADLLHVADALAKEARALAGDCGHDNGRGVRRAAQMAHGAKAALEAAALVDVDPAPVIAALERFVERVGQDAAAVQGDLYMSEPAVAIDRATELVEHYRREVRVGAAVQHGYLALRDLLGGLLRDFSAAETETARRIAARINTGLESAAEAIEQAKREQED
jgi:hypothetical protein